MENPSPEPAKLPPVPVDEPGIPASEAESIEGDARVLDLSLRRWAGRGALVLVALMYGAGFVAIATFMGAFACYGFDRATHDDWHLVVSVIVALFSIPTVLILAVLRSTSNFQKDATADSVHEAMGKAVMNWLNKAAGGKD
jgi:ABC-type glycerol-3-phosphate transport system permease component